MLFNSIEFAVFLPLVAVLYWLVFNKMGVKTRNLFLLFCSYFFYGMWDWRFLGLIVLSSVMDYSLGLLIGNVPAENHKKRKMLLSVSILVNLGILGFFKYAGFFVDSFIGLVSIFGIQMSVSSLDIILPVGISFYTFQSLSYIIDVYHRRIEPTRDIVAFMTFISFFPQLVAGPIERAQNLLPQFSTMKNFDYQQVRSGLLDIAIGLFKKMVIADRLAVYVDSVFAGVSASDVESVTGIPSVVALVFFAFQLYIDFSAYSQIAIGTAKVLGFSLSTNFRRPYLSTSFNVFWKRWHITLSQWMRDYIYIPLGGNRKGRTRTMLNLLIVFAVSGLWHGASWNFVIWGILNALFIILLDPLMTRLKIRGVFSSLIVFVMWTLSLAFFRAEGFDAALSVLSNLGFSNWDMLTQFGLGLSELRFTVLLLLMLMVFEYIVERIEGKGRIAERVMVFDRSLIVRWSIYILIPMAIILLGVYVTNNDNSFIYFQF